MTQNQLFQEYSLAGKKYNIINNITGWFTFVASAIVYLLTIEPTASFWDCGEFIASTHKLEVGHPPGAPFFMLTGKLFTLFVSDPSKVAEAINSMSALLSAATILFLFWSITILAKKLICPNNRTMTMAQLIVVMGSGLIGAMTYTFTDTFWFSAVEGEVYAYSSMLTALVFWLILKWENRADRTDSDKWIVLIAYVMGISIGVHLLNLLCIPAIVLVYYFRKVPNANLKGTFLALIISFALIVFLMFGIIPGFAKVGGWIELFFVNDLGFDYNTGTFIYFILLFATLIWGIYETVRYRENLFKAKLALLVALMLSGITFIGDSGWLWFILIIVAISAIFYFKGTTARLINTTLLCILVIMVGYSSFALIPIRSIANTPMDQNSPENIFTLSSYLNRDQYGDTPLLYGKTFASEEMRNPITNEVEQVGSKTYWDEIVKTKPGQPDEYVISRESPVYKYDNSMFFPRMYSSEPRHLNAYMQWADVTDFTTRPTYFQNFKYFVRYQLDHMYFRYFMWNFSGRQNDIQGNGEVSNGNWITGIKWFDQHILNRGPQTDLPPSIAENKGHNVYYAIPFIFGIFGIIFQFARKKEGEKQFLVVFTLFFMTGLAIILYLNQQPQEPRERDYAYAGSFYAYAIWIGLGVSFLWAWLKRYVSKKTENILAVVISIGCLYIPIQMAFQNWDDHDRSNRYTMRDFGQNYLIGLPENAILFTMGDNDTFPLWYSQEVENFRTDVRVCNLMYLQTDWYIDQMRRGAYDSKPLPISWTRDRYAGMKGYYAHIFPAERIRSQINSSLTNQPNAGSGILPNINYDNYFDTKAFVDTMSLANATEIMKTQDNYIPRNPFGIEKGVLLPSAKFIAPIDSSAVNWKSLGVPATSEFLLDLSNKNVIYRSDIMVMEMLKNINEDNWKRPIYYAMTIGEPPLNLQGHSIMEGIDYRIVPNKVETGKINLDITFENVMNKYKWGNAGNPKVYMDENNQRLARSFRYVFRELIDALIEQNDSVRALQALDKCIEVLPGKNLPRGMESVSFVDNYFELGQDKKADIIAKEILYQTDGYLQWAARMSNDLMQAETPYIREKLSIQFMVLNILQQYHSPLFDEYNAKTNKYLETFLRNGISFDNRNHPIIISMNICENALMDKLAKMDNVEVTDLAQMALDKDSTYLNLANVYAMILSIDRNAEKMFKFPEVTDLFILSIDDDKLTPEQLKEKHNLIEKIKELKNKKNNKE